MDQSTLRIDASNHRLRRVGRLVRRRMRIDGAGLTGGIHSDGRLSVVISDLATTPTDRPGSFQWWSDRPVALVIVRSGVDGEDVSMSAGPVRWGTWQRPGDRGRIDYVAFCYDTEPDSVDANVRTERPFGASLLIRLLRSGSPA